MSTTYLMKAARPIRRAVAGPGVSGSTCSIAFRQRFTTSAVRSNISGESGGSSNGKARQTRWASTWPPVSGAIVIATTAGLLGWSLSEFRHNGFPGTMLMDSIYPALDYASLHEMEQVRWCDHFPDLIIIKSLPSHPTHKSRGLSLD